MTDAGSISPLREFAKLARQLSRFGLVGLVATAVHLTIFSLLINVADLWPSIANLAGFLIAFCVSFAGQANWTFPSSEASPLERSRRFMRYIAVSLVGFLLNALTVFVVMSVGGYSYLHALPIMSIGVPTILFLLNRYWAFSDAPRK
jgi:putative flippase GtrA